jgi:integrase
MTDLIDRHLAASRAGGLAATTIDARDELLRRLNRELPYGIEEATTEELQEWLGRAGWATKTRETYWCHIVAFFRWATAGHHPVLDYDPSADMRRPRVGRHLPRVANDDQLALALRSLAQPERLAVVLAGGLGMRAGEVAAAERDSITEGMAIIHGKGDKTRAVPVPPDVWEVVSPYPTGLLLTDQHGHRVTSAWVTRHVSRALTTIGEPRLSLHWFRGAYATRLRRAGVDISAIARLMGHESVATTQRYIEIVDADLAAAVARMPRLPIRKVTGPASQ